MTSMSHDPAAAVIGAQLIAMSTAAAAQSAAAAPAITALVPAGAEEVSIQASMAFGAAAESAIAAHVAAQQELAIASCLAQAEAFMKGQPAAVVRRALEKQGLPPDRIAALVPHKVHEGSRPSSIVLFRRLDPATLGALIALYEHCVFTQSVVWGINAFDQWGVELGKKLTQTLVPLVRDPAQAAGASASVRGLLARVAAWRT